MNEVQSFMLYFGGAGAFILVLVGFLIFSRLENSNKPKQVIKSNPSINESNKFKSGCLSIVFFIISFGFLSVAYNLITKGSLGSETNYEHYRNELQKTTSCCDSQTEFMIKNQMRREGKDPDAPFR